MKTQTGNKINMSYDMTYFGKQEKQLTAARPTNRFTNISMLLTQPI